MRVDVVSILANNKEYNDLPDAEKKPKINLSKTLKKVCSGLFQPFIETIPEG
jgi:hypothetical protein